jgi:uncharacterized cysteine cluster protein YcgN (CxxCxxCC family)
VTNDHASVHSAGISVLNKIVAPQQAGPLQHHLYDWDDD